MSAAHGRKSRGPSRRGKSGRAAKRKIVPGQHASAEGLELRSYEVGALPLVNWLLGRMRLEQILKEHLPADDPRVEFPTVRALWVLMCNVLVSREPMYGVAEWAARFAPDLLDLWPHELPLLHDDRLGRCLEKLFRGVGPALLLAVTRHVVAEFSVSLDELHNDSTTVSFYGAYEEAASEGSRYGRPTHAITWGHSKDHRPDLKQLLYTLTVSEDGGVPVYFTSHSGNVVDDNTHCQTWDLLHQLVGKPEFLYVADCKLASSENLSHIASRGGRFVTVLPRTHKEDDSFRERLRQGAPLVSWKPLYDVKDADGTLRDRFSVAAEEMVSRDGYRLLWFHSRRKAQADELARTRRLQRALDALAELQGRLQGPRHRFRQRSKVEEAVAKLLQELDVVEWVSVQIEDHGVESYRQVGPGRPTQQTQYKKETKPGYRLRWELNRTRLLEVAREDGVFPLLTNDRSFDAEQVLRAYKRQPLIEKRFSQFKTDFAVAPVYLKSVTRIQGLLAIYFFVLVAQTLLERELRRGMAVAKMKTLPLYPEQRPCARPTTQRVLEIFAPVQRHMVRRQGRVRERQDGAATDEALVTALTPLQRTVLRLLGIPAAGYGH